MGRELDEKGPQLVSNQPSVMGAVLSVLAVPALTVSNAQTLQ